MAGSHVEFHLETSEDEVFAKQVRNSIVAVENVGESCSVLGHDVGPLIRLVGQAAIQTHMTLSAYIRVRRSLDAGTR